jgi:hypothetical protein
MVDVDSTDALVCPVISIEKSMPKPTKKIYRVSWQVHNLVDGRYYSVRYERLFETEASARKFNERRTAAAELVGLQEPKLTGIPFALTLESEDE